MIVCLLPLLLLYFARRRAQAALLRNLRRKKKGGGPMNDAIRTYIGKECVVSTLDDTLTGTVKEVADNWLILTTKDGDESVNLDYVKRVREYPRDKNGRRKVIVG